MGGCSTQALAAAIFLLAGMIYLDATVLYISMHACGIIQLVQDLGLGDDSKLLSLLSWCFGWKRFYNSEELSGQERAALTISGGASSAKLILALAPYLPYLARLVRT